MTDHGRLRPPGVTSPTEERPAQLLDAAALTFDLEQEIARLHREDAWERGDHNAKTLVKDEQLRVILVAMKAGARLPEHHAPTRISLQALSGRLRVHVAGQSIDLAAGSLATLAGGLAHGVEAVEDCAFLLTVSWQRGEIHPLERHSERLEQPSLVPASLDVRPMPPAERHRVIFDTFGSLPGGDAFILINDHDPKPLYYQFKFERSDQFTWEYLEQGPDVWRVRIGKTS